MIFRNFIYLNFAYLINYSLAAIPSDIPLCKAEDVECISKVTTDIIKNNAKGRPDIGLQQIDPYFLKSLVINRSNNGPVSLELSFKDLNIEGLSTLRVIRAIGFSKDPKTSKFEMGGVIPKLRLKGQYKINGKVLILPIQGEGNADIIMENVKTSIKFKPLLKPKDGKTFLAIDKIKGLFEPENVNIKFENLFNGDKTLGKQMNTFINENWKDIWIELGPSIGNAVAEVIRLIMTPLFEKYPYEDIYKD